MAVFKRWRSKAAVNLDHFYDDLIAGEPAPRHEVEPELATIAARLHQMGSRSVAPHAFKQQLWEDLMQSSSASTHSGFTGSRSPFAPTIDRRTDEWPRQTVWRGMPRSVLLQTAVAALLVVGLLAAFLPGFTDRGGGPELSLNAPIFGSPQATPLAFTGEVARPEDCTTHVLRLNEIAAILSAASRDVMYQGGQQRPTGPERLSLQPTEVAFAPVMTVDETIVAEIQPVYDMYFACSSAGSVRQKLYLMTPSGIARSLINPDGEPVWGNVVQLGLPPTPLSESLYIQSITATQ
ncbi:MAG: hypothetical protein KC438_10890, partial [Thermomicrobiales bacterium]|nr:hypothetical protein [Thermomicrobiales bacterium]